MPRFLPALELCPILAVLKIDSDTSADFFNRYTDVPKQLINVRIIPVLWPSARPYRGAFQHKVMSRLIPEELDLSLVLL